MYSVQDSIVFFPERGNADAVLAEVPDAEEADITAADGERLAGRYAPPADKRDGKIILYFHGNAGHLGDRADKLNAFARAGYGVLGISYRGYGESSGAPSEAGLRRDAIAAWGYLLDKGYAPENIIIYGESLGTAVALGAVAQDNLQPHLIVLEAPPLSILQRGRELYPWLPVRFLLRNKFESDKHAANVTAPALVIHGREDEVVPFAHGHAIYGALASPVKAFRQLENTGHSDFNPQELIRLIDEFREDKHLVQYFPSE